MINPDHPFVDGLPVSFTGNYASHDHFLNVPGKTTMITRDSERLQTIIEYRLGQGRIIASGVTLEASYAWGWRGGKILANIIQNALGDIPPPLDWLFANIKSGTIPPGSSEKITLTYDSARLEIGVYKARIVIKSNDPVNSTIMVPSVLEVTGGNCPVANPLCITTCMDTNKSIKLSARDDEGDPVTYNVVNQPSHGSLTGSAPDLTYIPHENYYGQDSFTFKANDGHCDSNIATVSITIERPKLTVDPDAINKNLTKGRTYDQTLTLTNTGCGTIKYDVSLAEVISPGMQDILGGLPDPRYIDNIPDDVEYVPGEVIVKFISNANQGEVVNLLNEIGATVEDRIPMLNMEVWKISVENKDSEEMLLDSISVLSNDPNVVYAEPNYIVKTIGVPDDLLFSSLWGLNNNGQANCMYDGNGDGISGADISAPGAWDRFTTGSSDVIVAVIDTGVDYNHNDLKENIWINDDETPGNGSDDDGNGFADDIHGYDFAYNDGDPTDGNKHGTHCAGTIGAVGNNGIGVVGVNHTVRIMALKFLNDYGLGSTDNAVKAIIYAVENGAHILSNSWGGGGFSNALKEAIIYANNHDVLFVAAAGNSNRDTDKQPNYPSCYDVANIMSIAATDCQDFKAWFSCWGQNSVDIGAPGVKILSTVPGNQYDAFNGTSMATPHVSGAAALLKAYKPDLKALEIKDLIMNNVDPADDLVGKTVAGGRLNVEQALEAIDDSQWISLSGKLSGYIPSGSSVTLTVTLDATGNKIGGEYTANITTVISDDPDNPVQVIVPVRTVILSDPYTLKINKQGNGKAKVDGKLYSLPWEEEFNEADQITVEAIPDTPAWKFKEWSGPNIGDKDKNPIVVTMDRSRTITAVLTNEDTVRLTLTGTGQVKVNETEHELPWHNDFVKGSSVLLEAIPASNFNKWTGDLEGSENPVAIVMEKDKQIIPVFEFREKWQTVILAQGEDIGGAGVSYDDWILLGDNSLVNKSKVIIGVDNKAETTPAPPAPPEYTVKIDLYHADWKEAFFKDIRKAGEDAYEWILAVNPHGNVMPPAPRTAIVSWDPDTLNPSGVFKLKDTDGKVIIADMRETSEFEVTGGDQPQFFYIQKTEGVFEMNLKAGWNMVSLPLVPDNPDKDALFPDAEAIFKFNGVYEPVETLEPNIGYWIKVPSDRTYILSGQNAVRNYDVELKKGWHLVGAPYGEARPEPADKIEAVYGFDDSYYQARKLVRGCAFWLKAGDDVKLNVNSQ